MKKTLLTFTLLAGLSSCTNLSEDLDMIGTQNITQTKSGNLSISENEPAIVKDLRNYISQIKLQGKQDVYKRQEDEHKRENKKGSPSISTK